MALTQQSVLSFLIEEGGKVRKSELVRRFKSATDCDDPEERARNRDLFKELVNGVAMVKEMDGARFVVVRKKYEPLVESYARERAGGARGEVRKGEPHFPPVPNDVEAVRKSEPQRPLVPNEVEAVHKGEPHFPPVPNDVEAVRKSEPQRPLVPNEVEAVRKSEPQRPLVPNEVEAVRKSEPQRPLVPNEVEAVRKSEPQHPLVPNECPSGDDMDVVRKGEPQRPSVPSGELHEHSENTAESVSPIAMALQRCKYDTKLKRSMNFDVQSKPYALPLRMPPTKVEFHKLKSNGAPCNPKSDQRWTKSDDAGANAGSPSLKRAAKSTKVSTEVKDSPSLVPLEQTEHEWLVKCASGRWMEVYGLLLRDSHLAEKRDFISGFTALHWVAKCGNSDMLVKIFELSKQGGVDVDVNVKTHGGYTPLHIAALHDQEYILAMLVAEYGADPKIRDNCGRRAYQYLHKGVSQTVREMLGQPKVREVKVGHGEKEEQDVFPDRSKGLHSISKLFQPNLTGHRRRAKQRPSLYSLQDEPEMEERDEGRLRLLSDVFTGM